MSDASKNIYVYADWQELKRSTLMGCINVQFVRGKEIFSFEFDDEWLKSQSALVLDPDLQLYAGRQYTDSAKGTFGIFMDSSPDRWGRQLMQRCEAIQARSDSRSIRQLTEVDYLLGVHDATRMGALRFKLDEAGDFYNNDSELPAPPWTSLRELEAACRHFEKDSSFDDEHTRWLSMLLAPGSSLGGVRPKANILDNESELWIAKFPSRADEVNIGVWEMVVHELASNIGISVPVCKVEKLSKHGSTFLTKRFDRKSGKRIHFASAMTLLGRMDGDDYNSGCSYLDLAQFIVQQSAAPNKDLEELWRRIAFSIAISNTDDHLRNHGFLLTPQGWRLSPVYDINPNSHGRGLSLNITTTDNSLDFELVLSIAEQFRLSIRQAKDYISNIKSVVAHWHEIAVKYKTPRTEMEYMAPAFRY